MDEVKIIFGPLNLRPKIRSKKRSKEGTGYAKVGGGARAPGDTFKT